MEKFLTTADIETAAESVSARSAIQPRVGLILGSGLDPIAGSVEGGITIPYEEIPHFPLSTVSGHQGRLVLGGLEKQPVVVMQGRLHYYEGYSMAQVTLPVRVMQLLGIEVLIVTCAAGGLNPDFRAGDVMLITDHISLIAMAGQNPLRGPNLDSFGPRFPDMSAPYDAQLRSAVEEAASEGSIPLRKGVYISLSGPSYESPADLHFLRLIGSDAVGMSTVPEVIVARHGGTRVLGLAGITNVLPLAGAPPVETTHEKVLAAGQVLVPRIEFLIRKVLATL